MELLNIANQAAYSETRGNFIENQTKHFAYRENVIDIQTKYSAPTEYNKPSCIIHS